MGNVCASNTANDKTEVVDSVPAVEDAPKENQQEVVVTIVGARGLRDSDWLPGAGKPDCYVEVRSADKLLHTTEVINNTCEPVWAEEKPLTELEAGASLEFTVWDKDTIGSDLLGKAVLNPEDYAGVGFNGELQLKDAKVPQAYLRVKVKMPGMDLPPGPAAEYTVTVEKQGKESWGLKMDKQDPKKLNIIEFKDGPFSKFNENAKPAEQVKVNDFLVSVNSAKDSAAMLAEFGTASKVECKFKRGMPISVVFDRGDASTPLGLETPEKPGSMVSIVVTGVAAGGALAKYNEAAKEGERISAGDRILAVGATRGKAVEVKKAIEGAKGQVLLTLLKPAVSRSDDGDEYTFGHWLFG